MIVSVWDALILFILGWIVAWIHKRWLRERNPDSYVIIGEIILLIFWIDLIACNLLHTNPWLIAPSNYVDPLLGVMYGISYLLWFMGGGELYFGFFGRTLERGGIFWISTLEDKTKPFEPAWVESPPSDIPPREQAEIWGNKELPKAGPMRYVPDRGWIIEIYDGAKIKEKLESMGFKYVGKVWEKVIDPKEYKKVLDELDSIGVHTETARKMHVYPPFKRD